MRARRMVTSPFAAPEAAAPLRNLPAAAEALGVRAVRLKGESTRTGTPPFKILGASWASCRVLADWVGVEIAEVADPALLRAELSSAIEATGQRPTLTAATDGNHGRSVAIMARLLGLPTRIFVSVDMLR